MPPAIPTKGVSTPDCDAKLISELTSKHREWFMTIDGRSPLNLTTEEFEFSAPHGWLIFSCWTETGSRTWRVTKSNWSGDKLVLQATRRIGAEQAAIELIPHASAKTIVASIAAARQERCEKLAQLVAENLGVGDRVLGVGDRVLGVGGGVLGGDPKQTTVSGQIKAEATGTTTLLSSSRNLHPTPDTQAENLGVGDRVLGVGDRVLGVGGGVLGGGPEQTTVSGQLKTDSTVSTPLLSSSRNLHPTPDTQHPSVKIERAALSPGRRRDQPGRYARIILRRPHERVAVTGTVAESDARNVDALFSSTLLWFQRMLQAPKRPSIQRLLLVVERQILDAARQRHVLLRDSLRERIELYEINDNWTEVTPVKRFERKHLWRKRLTRFPPVNEPLAIERANEILAQAPEAIDVVASRHGQTIRYHGLPFARLRSVMEQDRVWFGIEGSRRRQLDTFHQPDWTKLFRDLEDYRNESCRDRRHWLYRASGEAWLESILRHDITKLDPGLIIAPLHAQFRTSHGGARFAGGARPIDLLALRHDGRLVVIELKVTEDREHVFQGVDYWRRVEAHRRRGHISAAQLFGEREISDESPLVYLVAPTLHFHPSFRILAQTIAPDIEIYRFDINEDWRSGVRVVRRDRVN